MGAGESRPGLCGVGGADGFDMSCGMARGARRMTDPFSDDDPAIAAVAGWISAREAGDVELAASYCHKEFVFASPQARARARRARFFTSLQYRVFDEIHSPRASLSLQLSLAGLEAAKKRLFSQQAPVPIEVITALQAKEGSTKDRPMYFREVSFKVGPNKLAIRQEWVILLSGGKPLIGSVSASRVTPKADK